MALSLLVLCSLETHLRQLLTEIDADLGAEKDDLHFSLIIAHSSVTGSRPSFANCTAWINAVT